MKIIVCAKQIRHTYTRTGTSPDAYYINPEDSIYRVNPFDEAALELALRLKDQNPKIAVVLLTMGPMIAEDEIRRCMAAGADDLYQINVGDAGEKDPLDQQDPWVKSDLLARAVKVLAGDLVLCGKESLDRGNGQIGSLLAHRLGRPFVSAITDVSVDETAGTMQVQRSAGRGVREIIQCRTPAVFSVDLGQELRFPRFDRTQWAKGYTPKGLDYGNDIDTPKVVCSRRFQPRPRPKQVPAPDSRLHAYDRVSQLLTGSKVEKKGEILSGNPESQVEGMITFLKVNGFLETDNADQ